MGVLFGKLISNLSISLLCSKGLKVLGKKDFADIIKFCGFSISAVTVYEIIQYVHTNSKLIQFTEWLMK